MLFWLGYGWLKCRMQIGLRLEEVLGVHVRVRDCFRVRIT